MSAEAAAPGSSSGVAAVAAAVAPRPLRVAPVLTLQQLVAAAERLAQKTGAGRHAVDWLGLVDEARDRLVRAPFVAEPMHGFEVRTRTKTREVAAMPGVEHLIEEALAPVVTAAVEPRLSDAVHGYRRRRSTFTAACALERMLARGLRHVLQTDVDAFFPSVAWPRLAEVVGAILPPRVAEVVMTLVRAPIRHADGTVEQRERGLPLGRTLAPVLANAFLTPADDAVLRTGAGYLRYADDIVVAAAKLGELERAHAALAAALATLDLSLKPEKTGRTVYDGRALAYLGHRVDAHGVYAPAADADEPAAAPGGAGSPRPAALHRLPPSKTRLSRAAEPPPGSGPAAAGAGADVAGPGAGDVTPNRRDRVLYVTQPGMHLRAQLGAVQVMLRDEKLREVPFDRIDRVVVTAGASFTSAFVAGCVERAVPVIFFVGKGRAFGTLVSSESMNPLRLRAQYDLLADPLRRTELARSVVAAKVESMIAKVSRRGEPGGVAERLTAAREAAALARDDAQLLGAEGAATAAYFQALAAWVRPPEFAWTGRTKRPPKDPLNSLFSFAYALLFGEMHALLLAHGLDPHPGLVHGLRKGHPALASDLIEPYRALVADPFVLRLVNQRMVKADEFEKVKGGVYMRRETLRRVLQLWENHLRRPLGGSAAAGTPRGMLDGAALAMLAVVLGETDRLDLPFRGLEDEPARWTEPPAEEPAGPPGADGPEGGARA